MQLAPGLIEQISVPLMTFLNGQMHIQLQATFAAASYLSLRLDYMCMEDNTCHRL